MTIAATLLAPVPVDAADGASDAVEPLSLHDAWRSAMASCEIDICVGLLVRAGASHRGVVLAAGLRADVLVEHELDLLRTALVARRRDHLTPPLGWRTLTADDLTGWAARLRLPVGSRARALLTRIDTDTEFWLIAAQGADDCRRFDAARAADAARIMALCALGRLATQARATDPGRLRMLENVLDEFAPSMVLVDRDARICWANAPGEQMLGGQLLLRRGCDGRVSAMAPGATASLRGAIAGLVASWIAGGESRDRRVTIDDLDGRSRLLIVRALPADGEGTEPVILLILPRHDMLATARGLNGAFGIIPSEARFIAAIVECGSVQDAAARLNLSPSTSRTYLKRIYAKLGIGSQFELARFVASLTPPLSADRRAMPAMPNAA